MPAAYPPPPLPHTQVREECGIVLCLAMEAAAPPPAAHAALGAQLAAEVSDLVAHLVELGVATHVVQAWRHRGLYAAVSTWRLAAIARIRGRLQKEADSAQTGLIGATQVILNRGHAWITTHIIWLS